MTAASQSVDIRTVIASLVYNESIVRPATITATGREAPWQYAIVPAGTSITSALMPHVDYQDRPDHRPGSGFLGGRLSTFVPYLKPGALPSLTAITVRVLPADPDAILRDLRASAGLHWAPGAWFRLAGWSDEAVATWLDHLRRNNDEARLLIAHAQATLALRKMWLAVVWHDPLCPPRNPPLAMQSGAVAVGRALVDVMAIFDRIVAHARSRGLTNPDTDLATARLLTCLHHFLRHVTAADQSRDVWTHIRKLKNALVKAKSFLDGIGLFSVSSEQTCQRWKRLAGKLENDTHPRDHAGSIMPKLDRFTHDLERLQCASLGSRLTETQWRPHIRRALLRLGLADRSIRLAQVDRFRGDLIYRLAISGRLDRLYMLFPWLAAPHGGFPGCPGGALGALASLFECGRVMQVGKDLKRRLEDDGSAGVGATSRLTIPNARSMLEQPLVINAAIDKGYVLGEELIRQSISHARMRCALEGALFGPHASLTHAQKGRLGWNDGASFQNPATATGAIAIIAGSNVLTNSSHDDDVPRYMGLTPLRLINTAIRSIFETEKQRRDFENHRILVLETANNAGRKPSPAPQIDQAKLALQDSMLLSLDHQPDDRTRDTLRDWEVPGQEDSTELVRAASLMSTPTRSDHKDPAANIGQGRRNATRKEPLITTERAALLRVLAEDAGRWRKPDKKDRNDIAPLDDMLEDLLRGKLAFRQPVSDLFVPLLWLAPCIDRHLLGWIGRGAPAIKDIADQRFEALREEAERVRAWGPALFAAPQVTGRDDRIACHLFTGVSPITSDSGHA